MILRLITSAAYRVYISLRDFRDFGGDTPSDKHQLPIESIEPIEAIETIESIEPV